MSHMGRDGGERRLRRGVRFQLPKTTAWVPTITDELTKMLSVGGMPSVSGGFLALALLTQMFT